MTEATKGNKTLIKGIDDVIAPFLAGNAENKAGIELEFTILKHGPGGRLSPINNAECKELQQILANPYRHSYGFTPIETSEEAATMTLEVKTTAAAFNHIEDILTELENKLGAVQAVCADKGYILCPYAQAPHITLHELFNLVIARDSNRAEAFISSFKSHGLEGYYRNFFLNNAVQTSVTYKDPDHLFQNVRRLACLTAPLSAAHDNSSGFIEGERDPGQTGLRLREHLAQGGRGGAPDFFFTSRDGEDFIRNYFAWVFATPLLARYDANGDNLAAVSPGDDRSFNDLIAEDEGLNNQTNFELAFGMLWPHIKLAYVRDESGAVTGVRYEARACDAGGWRNQSFPLIVAALAFDDEYAAAVDSLLAAYGLGENALPLYRDSVKAALDYQDHFGTGTLTGFLARFAKLTRDAFEQRPELLTRLEDFLAVCESRTLPGSEIRSRSENFARIHNTMRQSFPATKGNCQLPGARCG